MKVTWNKADIMGYVQKVTWQGSAAQACRYVTIDLASSPEDKNFAELNVKNGDVIRMFNDGDKLIFLGKVTDLEKRSEAGTKQIIAKDYMENLLRSKGTYKFKKKTPERITRAICKDLGVSVGSLAKTKMRITKLFAREREYYNIILAAYTKAHKKNGKKYFLRMDGAKLEVIEKGKVIKDFRLVQGENVTSSEYAASTGSMVNRVAIYDKKNKKIGTISNKDWVKKYGAYQEALTVESGNGKKKAKNMLVGIEKTYNVTAIGAYACLAGRGVKIDDPATGLTGTFWIESDTHNFENGTHTMELELTFKNIMETANADKEDKNAGDGAGTKTVSTGILNGKKVKALFTAYYPANNKMEGGFLDAQGNKLDPKKKTCAAPGSVKFGTRIQIGGTGTSKDKAVYKVTDRGGAITIKNGVYHFDLLMSTKAECNRWGKREGYAIIGNGTGYKKKTVTTVESYTGGKLKWPVPGYSRISSDYGNRICPFHGPEKHTGIDIPAPYGTRVIAVASGKVIDARNMGSYGNGVLISHGSGIYTLYAHNSKLEVKKGQAVSEGQTIARIGSTGSSTGNHCHFEVRKGSGKYGADVNPRGYLGR